MTNPSDEFLPTDPHDGIDPADNKDARLYEATQSPSLGRSSDGDGNVPIQPTPAGEDPHEAGTGAGDALQGVHISDEDAANAVSGDQGPEHPGVRRSS